MPPTQLRARCARFHPSPPFLDATGQRSPPCCVAVALALWRRARYAKSRRHGGLLDRNPLWKPAVRPATRRVRAARFQLGAGLTRGTQACGAGVCHRWRVAHALLSRLPQGHADLLRARGASVVSVVHFALCRQVIARAGLAGSCRREIRVHGAAASRILPHTRVMKPGMQTRVRLQARHAAMVAAVAAAVIYRAAPALLLPYDCTLREIAHRLWNMREVHAVSRPTARDHHTSFLAIATAAVAVDVMRQPAQLWCGGALGRGSEVGSVSREDGHWLPHVVWGITSSASSFSTPGYCVRAASKPNAARACIECCNPTCVCACALGQSLDFVRALYKYFVPS